VAELAQSDRRQFLLCLAGFADLFCVSMVITCLPIHLKQIGMAPFYMGLFQSEYGAVQIFSSSICGRLVRRFGARNAHSLCCVASAAGYLALGLGPPDFPSLASLRLITALFKHTQTLQRTQLASSPDVSESRWIRLLGSHSTLSSLGFIVGPMVGGVAFDFGGFRLVTGLACVGFLAVGIATAVSAAAPAAEVAPKSSGRSSRPTPTSSALSAALAVADLLALQLPMSLAAQLFRHNFALALNSRFSASSAGAGLATSLGAVSGLLSGLAVGPLQSATGLGPDRLVLLAAAGQAACLSLAASGLVTSLAQFAAAQAPLSFFNGLARDAYPTLLRCRLVSSSFACPEAALTDAMAASQSVNSLARLLAPLLGGCVEAALPGHEAPSQPAAALISVCLACPLAAAAPAVNWLQSRRGRLAAGCPDADRKSR
ncbi:hypothetical protein BOX15_Mlig033358g11, partial [Macrostomum lignano]